VAPQASEVAARPQVAPQASALAALPERREAGAARTEQEAAEAPLPWAPPEQEAAEAPRPWARPERQAAQRVHQVRPQVPAPAAEAAPQVQEAA
jgi:hypothetical protein